MSLAQVTQRAVGASIVIPVDLRRFSQGVGLILNITGTLTATIQITGDNVQKEGYTAASGNWIDHDALLNLTASKAGSLSFPVSAIRLNIIEYTSGTAVLSVVQAGG